MQLANVNESRVSEFVKFARKHQLLSNAKVVEVGCGNGKLSYLLANEFGYDISLIDIVDQRDPLFTENREFYQVDCAIEALPQEDGTVDMLIATQVIEHIENLTHFFNEVKRVLKPGGMLLLSYPNFVNIKNRLHYLLHGTVLRLSGVMNSGGHINLVSSQITHWSSPYFELKDMQGDFLAIVGKIMGITRKLFPEVGDRHLIVPFFKGILFSYNINACYLKKN